MSEAAAPLKARGQLNLLDRAISWANPLEGLRRLQARSVLARYEAARPSKQRGKASKDNSTAETHVARDAATIRAIAREMERDHDVVRGALSQLSSVIVGDAGVNVEPLPRTADDSIHDEFARDLLRLYADWQRRPEVTHTMDWAMVQDLVCRAWLRDGEVFAQAIEGPAAGLNHGTMVPFSIELLEADMCPLDYRRESPLIEAGIERNAWGQPLAFHLWKHHPGSTAGATLSEGALKRVSADRILHVANRDRFSGLRGVSVFASVIQRLGDIKDYEGSERMAARIAAAIAAYIKRDKDMTWTAPEEGEDGSAARSVLRLAAGTILDQLQPGEELQMLNANRPNTALEAFVNHNYRGAAAGLDLSYSSLARHYGGNFSAQRQELVESWKIYRRLTARFVCMFVRPAWERFVRTAIASGQLRVPREVRPETVTAADFRGPSMPWIDPLKEAAGLRTLVRSGFTSARAVIAERGGRLQDTFEEIKRERDLADELGLVFDSDARQTSAAGLTQARNPGSQLPDTDTDGASETDGNPDRE